MEGHPICAGIRHRQGSRCQDIEHSNICTPPKQVIGTNCSCYLPRARRCHYLWVIYVGPVVVGCNPRSLGDSSSRKADHHSVDRARPDSAGCYSTAFVGVGYVYTAIYYALPGKSEAFAAISSLVNLFALRSYYSRIWNWVFDEYRVAICFSRQSIGLNKSIYCLTIYSYPVKMAGINGLNRTT